MSTGGSSTAGDPKESAWIAPYIPALLLLLRCHVNVDVCFTANVVLYLYKYLFKGAGHYKV